MMLYPPVAELVDKVGSRYQLVNLVARRARTLAAEADNHEISEWSVFRYILHQWPERPAFFPA